MSLHLVFASPYHSDALQSCQRSMGPNDVLVLLQDGVYAGVANSHAANSIVESGRTCYVMQDDLAARGLTQQLANDFEAISYEKLVELSIAHPSSQSWY